MSVASIERNFPARVISREISGDLRHQIKDLFNLDFKTFFIYADADDIGRVLTEADSLKLVHL